MLSQNSGCTVTLVDNLTSQYILLNVREMTEGMYQKANELYPKEYVKGIKSN